MVLGKPMRNSEALENTATPTKRIQQADGGPLPAGRPIVYFVNQYPAVSHTFIRREILALERLKIPIVRIGLRHGPDLTDPADASEKSCTTYILFNRYLILAGIAWAMRRPSRLFRSLATAQRLWQTGSQPMWRSLACLVEACALGRLISQIGASHVHAHFGTNSTDVVMLAAILTDSTFSFTVHGPDEFDRPVSINLAAKVRAAEFVATVSMYGQSQLMRWCAPEDRSKIKLVRCGLVFGGTAFLSKRPRHSERFVNVGRLCNDKAQQVFIEAVAALRARGRNIEGVLVGDGETREELQRLIDKSDLSSVIRLTGNLSGSAVLEEIEAARALVVSSFAENLPVVILEAMSMSRPVVATWIAGIPEIVVPGETGWLAAPGSVEALAREMEACLSLSDCELAKMGKRCRERVFSQHDIDVEARKLAALLPR